MDYLQITFIVLTGLMAGVMSGFAGVGGAFIVTPALIILGIPAHLAVGSSIFWVAINSFAGTLLHRKMGNVDIKLGLVMAPAVMGGVEIGVRILNGVKRMGIADEAVLLITVCLLSIVGFGTLLEAMKRKHGLDLSLQQDGEATSVTEKPALSLFVQKIQLPPYLYLPTSGVRISLWVALIIGVCVGTLAGFIGVGGGFIMMPAFIYIMGIPTLTALGTDLFQIIISATYGTVRHYSSGNTVVSLVVLLLPGSLIGVLFGTRATRYVRGVTIRFVLGIAISFGVIGALLKLIGIMVRGKALLLEKISLVVTFGGMGAVLIFIMALVYFAARQGERTKTPRRFLSFIRRPPP